jgi:hypothetical protein
MNRVGKTHTDTNEDSFVARVVVENFPSRVELYDMLDEFLQKNGYVKDYTSDNKDKIVFFFFKRSVNQHNIIL